MDFGYLCLALILCLPVLAFVILHKVKEMHVATLNFMKETQVVGGQPTHLIEKKVDLATEQAKDQRDRNSYISDEMKRRAMQVLG